MFCIVCVGYEYLVLLVVLYIKGVRYMLKIKLFVVIVLVLSVFMIVNVIVD